MITAEWEEKVKDDIHAWKGLKCLGNLSSDYFFGELQKSRYLLGNYLKEKKARQLLSLYFARTSSRASSTT